ncbi:hypothetical protein [Lactobacillus delbrueckii]|uniref:hypothetical protein n=3 Tax=Lactobacillus delbrueckii TaxID=1584 RepID=UPI0039C885D2
MKLGTEYHGLSYDALTAHTAFVFLRYMFMSVEKRDDEDDRTIGELFYCMVDELADITFQSLPTNPGGSHVRECERDLPTDRRADGKVHQRFHFTPPEVHARGYIAITSSLIEYLLAKLLSFQVFIVLFGVGSLSYIAFSAAAMPT